MTDTFDAVVETISDVHPEIRILRVRPGQSGVIWRAGQYMELMFDGFPARPYSIASAPQSGVLEFHIRNTGHGGVSQHAVKALKAGDHLTLRGPFGKAVMVAGETMPIIMIGGGMGLSPLKAMIEDSLQNGYSAPITLYWGTRDSSELYMADHFRALMTAHPSFRFVPVAQDQSHQLVGDAVAAYEDDLSGTRIYLAGPHAMIAAIVPVLLQKKAAIDRIHSDDDMILQTIRNARTPS